MISDRKRPTRVCVVGAGVIGLSTAVNILETWHSSPITVIILADKFSPHTTSDVAAGLCMPSSAETNPLQLVNQWCKETIDRCVEIIKSVDAADAGVSLLSGFKLCSSEKITRPFYADSLLDFRPMNDRELSLFNSNDSDGDRVTHGWAYTTTSCSGRRYLPWLTKRFESKGGILLRRKISNLKELYNDFDVIVNCCGLGNYTLLNDIEMRPIRGQVIRVDAPWVKHAISNSSTYILPSFDQVVLGGIRQVDNWNLDVVEQENSVIWARCCRLLPSIKHAKIIKHDVGLRPGRRLIRLESEVVETTNKRLITIIHNYGHSGSGITLHWGCALAATRLFEKALVSSLSRL